MTGDDYLDAAERHVVVSLQRMFTAAAALGFTEREIRAMGVEGLRLAAYEYVHRVLAHDPRWLAFVEEMEDR